MKGPGSAFITWETWVFCMAGILQPKLSVIPEEGGKQYSIAHAMVQHIHTLLRTEECRNKDSAPLCNL